MSISVMVTKIEMDGRPLKTEYTVGDTLDLTGFKIKVTKNDGSVESLSVLVDWIIGFDTSTVGKKILTITYMGKICTTNIRVHDGLIKVGIINNPPSESGYRTANVMDLISTFTLLNGYKTYNAYTNNHEEQLQAFNQFIAFEVDYILLSAASRTGWDDLTAAAKKAGIPVILFDRMIDYDGYTAAVVSDMFNEGKMAVNWLLSQKLDVYNIIHLQGEMGTAAQIGRSGALEAAAADNAKITIVEQQTGGNWNADQAREIVETVITRGDNFNVIYAENDDMAMGAVQALDAAGISHGAGGDVIIISFDCNRWALEEVLAGNWNYNGQCSPFQAALLNKIIKDFEEGIQPEEKIIYTKEMFFEAGKITAEDVSKFGI